MSGIVYIMASRKNGTLYAGVTADPVTRIWEHRDKIYPKSFTARYNVTRLVWYHEFDDIVEAIRFEKRLKRWRRHWKIRMIEKMNPEWEDLYFHFATWRLWLGIVDPTGSGPAQAHSTGTGMTAGRDCDLPRTSEFLREFPPLGWRNFHILKTHGLRWPPPTLRHPGRYCEPGSTMPSRLYCAMLFRGGSSVIEWLKVPNRG